MSFYKWESVESPCVGDYTERLYIHGGWIVRNFLKEDNEYENNQTVCNSMVFIPDPNHEWTIKQC